MGKRLFHTAAGITAFLLLVPILVDLRFLWGVNHLAFLPAGFVIPIVTVGMALIVAAIIAPKAIESVIESIVPERATVAFGIAVGFALLFWLSRSPVHFLGDGYTNIAVFGQGEGSLYKWTSYGSMVIVRNVQRMFGALDKQHAETAFQIVSVLSGGVAVFALLRLSRLIGESVRTRALAAVTMVFSGALLLYFGYTEFYPPLWACGALFFLLAVRCTRTGRGLLWCWLALGASMAMHLQAAVLIPALLWLMFARTDKATGSKRFTRTHWMIAGGLAVLGLAAFVWLYTHKPAFEAMFLPLFTGRPQSPGYAVISLKHAVDLANLVLLICPGVLLLMALKWTAGKTKPQDSISTFLAISSVGSLAFLILIDPVFGAGRDWDLLSFTLLPAVLWLLRRIAVADFGISTRQLAVFTALALVASGSYVAANTYPPSAAQRFESLLEFYDRKDRSGWSILADYHRESGRSRAASQAIAQMKQRFPEYDDLEEAYRLVNAHRYQEALPIARRLADGNPYNADFLQILGNILGKLGDFEEAERLYKEAVALKPYNVGLRNEFGQLYINYGRLDEGLAVLKRLREFNPQLTYVAEGVALAYIRKGEYDSALGLADTLLATSSHAPGACLIRTTVAVNRGDTSTARANFRLFVEYGKGRSDYEAMVEYYSFLIQ
ncbi:tetratricopeptide repeat protein [bacterium]|nr:tetratricopeptide repeat protein [bacterium]